MVLKSFTLSMTGKQQLNEKWIKASILGTIWASFEVVLGSFLHNLRIPFSGNILTALALIILISVSYRWKEKGLFWRAGIICALLKTMSPSAVIFGPMIAILSEAFLLEVSVRVFGKTILGYLLGSALAMSWVLFQKIANYIIFYGYNIIELYEGIMRYAQKQLHWQFDAVWAPILLLLSIYILFGSIPVIIGIKTGRRLASQPIMREFTLPSKKINAKTQNTPAEFNYSIPWLIFNFLLIIASLILLNYLHFIFWLIMVGCIVSFWAIRYKRALRQLVRPKFWIFFVLITMATAFVFTKIQSTANSIPDGLLIGVEMNLRAIILIMGFSVLGTELYNPKIRNYFMKGHFTQLLLAFELSLESLPLMIANIPDFKSIVKNPVLIFHQIIFQVEQRLAEVRDNKDQKPAVFILTGTVGGGKSTQIQKIIKELKSHSISLGGIYSLRIVKKNITTGYDIVNISTNERSAFLQDAINNDLQKIGRFTILPEGLEKGLKAIEQARKNNATLTIIDEVGKLELENKGWSNEIDKLLYTSSNNILLVVRKEFVENIIEKWKIKPRFIYNVAENDFNTFCNLFKN